jgi:hypothetical protein
MNQSRAVRERNAKQAKRSCGTGTRAPRPARLLARGKGLDGERLGDAGEALEVNLAGGRVVDGDLVDGRPQHELLGLDTLELLDALGLHVPGDLHVVALTCLLTSLEWCSTFLRWEIHMYPVARTKPTSITSASGSPNSSSSDTAIFRPSSWPFLTTAPSLSAIAVMLRFACVCWLVSKDA